MVSTGKTLITPVGFKKLQDEIQWLWKDERPRVTAEVGAAAALGDRSENAEYIYGKKRLREIDRRMRFLGKRLDDVQVMRPPVLGPVDKVGFGSFVTVEDEEGETRVFHLVGPDEFDADNGKISVESPVGKALLGRKRDDEVEVKRPRGDTSFTVIAIEFRPVELDAK